MCQVRRSVASRREAVFQLALQGKSSREIATLLNIPLRTIQRDLAALEPELRAERQRMLASLRDQLLDAGNTAIATLRAIAADPAVLPAVRVQASVGILSQLGRLHELVCVAERLAAIEERLAGLEERAKGVRA